MGKSSKTTTTVQTSAEEKAYQKANTDLAIQQLALTQEQHEWNSEIFEMTKPLLMAYGLMTAQQLEEMNTPEALANKAKGQQLEGMQLDSAIANQPLQDEMLRLQLEDIKRGGRATPEQEALIDEIKRKGIESGDIDISRFLSKGLQQVGEELAPARGMRPDDGPIVDAGDRVLEEAIRQKGQLTSTLEGGAAQAKLNFPLAASQAYGALGQWQQQFGAGMTQFLASLRQQALSNQDTFRNSLFTAPQTTGEMGIGLINASRPTGVSFARDSTTKQSGGGSIAGGIGGFLQGVGSIAGLFSSEKAKTDIKPITAPPGHILSPGFLKQDVQPLDSVPANPWPSKGIGFAGNQLYRMLQTKMTGQMPPNPMEGGGQGPPKTDEEMLQRVSQLPVSSWKYKPETGIPGDTHVGPMAEHFNTQIMGKGPQPTINIVDIVGSLTSAVKALEARSRAKAQAAAAPAAAPQPQAGSDLSDVTPQPAPGQKVSHAAWAVSKALNGPGFMGVLQGWANGGTNAERARLALAQAPYISPKRRALIESLLDQVMPKVKHITPSETDLPAHRRNAMISHGLLRKQTA